MVMKNDKRDTFLRIKKEIDMMQKDVKGEKKENSKFICWISEQEQILSFHYEEGYARKEFKNREELRQFVLSVSKIYKVQ